MSLNQSKWTQMTLNVPQWAQTRWMQSTSAQTIVECLPVMYVSLKDMLKISKQFKKNNQKALLWPIFIRLLRHAL